ncbi:MAG: hypothetical protein HY961_05955 [Ignavibacteriae bacterium]|nr:hypothetical protein [Ignavibacteriota bacterium]
MKARSLSVLVVALAFAIGSSFAGDKDQKNTKSTTKKKATLGCCSHEGGEKKECTELEMKECEDKEMKTSAKPSDKKTDVKKVEKPELKKK